MTQIKVTSGFVKRLTYECTVKECTERIPVTDKEGFKFTNVQGGLLLKACEDHRHFTADELFALR